MEPDKRVEMKPQMAQHNSAENTGLDCCWSTKTRYIHFSLISCITVYPIHGEVTIVGATSGDEIFVRTPKLFPIRIGQSELSPDNPKGSSPVWRQNPRERLRAKTDSFPRLMNFVSSRKLR